MPLTRNDLEMFDIPLRVERIITHLEQGLGRDSHEVQREITLIKQAVAGCLRVRE